MAHLLEQIIELYPGNTLTIYTNTWFTWQGTPYGLFTSPDATGPGLFLIDDGTTISAISISSITAIYLGAGSVYNPSITYLTPELPFNTGCDTNLITAIHDYLPVSLDQVTIYVPILTQASGAVYIDEYGIIVLSDELGNTPIFISSCHIAGIEKTLAAQKKQNEILKATIEFKYPDSLTSKQ